VIAGNSLADARTGTDAAFYEGRAADTVSVYYSRTQRSQAVSPENAPLGANIVQEGCFIDGRIIAAVRQIHGTDRASDSQALGDL
jgi:hypothetical protein